MGITLDLENRICARTKLNAIVFYPQRIDNRSNQARVEKVRELQRNRIHRDGSSQTPKNMQRISYKSDIHPSEIRKSCPFDYNLRSLVRSALHQINPPASAYNRMFKSSRKIADLEGLPVNVFQPLAEALQSRLNLNQY